MSPFLNIVVYPSSDKLTGHNMTFPDKTAAGDENDDDKTYIKGYKTKIKTINKNRYVSI